MDNIFQVDILSLGEPLYSGKATFAVLPGEAGELGVYPGHAPLLTRIRPGTVKVREADSSTEHYMLVAGGVLEVLPDAVIVLADHAVRTVETDQLKADEARRTAQLWRSRYADLHRHVFDFAAAKSELSDELRRYFALALQQTAR